MSHYGLEPAISANEVSKEIAGSSASFTHRCFIEHEAQACANPVNPIK
jgi:hypothetical protein